MAQPATKRKHKISASDAVLGTETRSLIGALIESEVRRAAVPPVALSIAINGSAAALQHVAQPPVAADFDVDVAFNNEAPAARFSSDGAAAHHDGVAQLASRHGDNVVENDDDDDDDDDEGDEKDYARARDDEFDNDDDNRPPSERDDASSSDEESFGGAALPQPHQQAPSQDPIPAVFQLDGAMFATQPPVLTKDSHAFRARFGTFLSGLSAPLLGFFKRVTLLLSFLLVVIFTGYSLRCARVGVHSPRLAQRPCSVYLFNSVLFLCSCFSHTAQLRSH